MVEEIHEPDGGAANDSHRERRNEGIARWLTRLLVGVLGLSAAARSLLASRPAQGPTTVPERIHQPDAEEVRHPDGRIEHPQVRYRAAAT